MRYAKRLNRRQKKNLKRRAGVDEYLQRLVVEGRLTLEQVGAYVERMNR